MIRADLHAHSTCSDGLWSPARLVREAAAAGVTHLALTDHDTTAGVDEARAEARSVGIVLVPGIEITCTWRRRELHLLGLGLDPDSPALRALCDAAVTARRQRVDLLCARMREQGLPVTPDEVWAEAVDATSVGRPHVAQVLLRKGLVSSMQEAFSRYLSDTRVGDLPRAAAPLEDAARTIVSAGGLPSLAHPGLHRIGRGELPDLAQAGIRAVEARHPQQPPSQQEAYQRWAAGAGLVCSGGSDTHGVGRSGALPGACTLDAPQWDALGLGRRFDR